MKIVRCSHHFCRTTLTEDTAAYCPHGLAFCEAETWEDGCEECAIEPLRQRAQAAWDHAATNQPPYLTAAEIAAGDRGERTAEDRAYELARLEDREEMRAS